jgi:outer membrane biosynthesis protein TonB
MHLNQVSRGIADKRTHVGVLCGVLVILALVFAACGTPAQPEAAEEPAAAEPAATEPPAEEPAAEATEPPAEEPAAEAEATEPPAEEAAETEAITETEEVTETEEAAEAEATEPAEEEPAAEATEPAEEEAVEATPTAPAEEEAAEEGAEATETPPAEEEAALSDGEYIMTLMGCGCHFNRELGGLAGGNDFSGDYGTLFAPNITPDPETGIGNWSEDEIAAAIRTGVRPDGAQLFPIMPYMRFSALSDQEALALASHLLSMEPVVNDVQERELAAEPEPFTPATTPSAEPPTDPAARGEQLVTLANCSGCHTPRNDDGTPNMDLFLAGAPFQEDEISANITPHEEFGIGSWSEEQIAAYLKTGERPDGSNAGGAMAQEIDRRFHLLTDEDAAAIAAFLKSVPAVEHDPFAE